MAIKFQYNKTSLQQIEKQLKMRQRTLPIIKSKETALRLEVKKCKAEAAELEEKLNSQIGGYESTLTYPEQEADNGRPLDKGASR